MWQNTRHAATVDVATQSRRGVWRGDPKQTWRVTCCVVTWQTKLFVLGARHDRYSAKNARISSHWWRRVTLWGLILSKLAEKMPRVVPLSFAHLCSCRNYVVFNLTVTQCGHTFLRSKLFCGKIFISSTDVVDIIAGKNRQFAVVFL